jgi:putative restriction endonuclease
MTNSDLLSHFQNINTWENNGERAPHKPLLMLLALGELQRGLIDFIPYTSIEQKLKDLLLDFGKPRTKAKPHYPFVRLAKDGLWVLDKPIEINSSGDARVTELRERAVGGKFTEEVTQQLKQSPELFISVVENILVQNFPETLHQDILDAVGIKLDGLLGDFYFKRVKKRDPFFRDSILKAYGNKCAVCGYSVWLHKQPLAIEAAHIKWHQAGGPDKEINGIALCSTHHRLFDAGAFTVSAELEMRVFKEVKGEGAYEWLFKHNGKSISHPTEKAYYPNPEFTEWHVKEVFKGDYRS